jgi:hypothetical protein
MTVAYCLLPAVAVDTLAAKKNVRDDNTYFKTILK